jgi:CrcB protein
VKQSDEVGVAVKAPPAATKHADHGSAARENALLYLSVCVGSIIGSVLRGLSSVLALAWFGSDFPWGTLFVNVVGSFVIGFYAALAGPDGRMLAGTRQRQFVMTGICGGFTTFSAFSLETFRSAQAGDWLAAGLNVGVSIVAWLAAVWLGHTFASRLNRLGGI